MAINPALSKVFLSKAQVYSKMDNAELLGQNVDKFIEQSSSDQTTVDQANAQKGLALETGDAAAKAKYHWEIGYAQATKMVPTPALKALLSVSS